MRKSEEEILLLRGGVMKSSLRDQIYHKIADYILEEITLKELEDWLIPATWNLHQESDRQVVDLANEVVLLLMEYSNEHRTESEIREILREKVTHIFDSVTIDEKTSPYSPIVSASSSQAYTIIKLPEWKPFSDRQSEAVFAS